MKKGDIWSQAVSSGLVRDMKFGYDEDRWVSREGMLIIPCSSKGNKRETIVILVYSVYFSKFTSQILILDRKAASKQVE